MSDKRIIEYNAATEARTDDNILMDSPAVGTRKITKANFLADVYTAFQTIGNSITGINTFIGDETLQTEADTITGAINEILNNAATAIELTQAEYDALVLADEDKENVPYYISDAQSPAQIGLWAKVGSDALNVGDDLSDAVNELDNSVRTIKSNLTEKTKDIATQTISSTQTSKYKPAGTGWCFSMRNGIVSLDFVIDVVSASSTWLTVGTLPSDIPKPAQTIYMPCNTWTTISTTKLDLAILDTGEIQMRGGASTQYYIHLSW